LTRRSTTRTKTSRRLRETCPDGVDLYFDNVGGSILNDCLANLAMRGASCCAARSPLQQRRPTARAEQLPQPAGPPRAHGGLHHPRYLDRFPAAQLEVAGWIAEGKIKSSEHIVQGLEKAPDALNLLFSGGNTGKVIVAL
jgi:NADPH-dependent curcumin reductase CurA